ncbi:MAG: hypothetical protein HYS21_13155 [Deltaproteobacteria bacterium]|nr:hypothetical protein [Deltaproteobacteria bacterium]
MSKDIQKLRERAARLLEKAEKLEDEKALKIGRMILKHKDNDFANFNLTEFKKQLEDI